MLRKIDAKLQTNGFKKMIENRQRNKDSIIYEKNNSIITVEKELSGPAQNTIIVALREKQNYLITEIIEVNMADRPDEVLDDMISAINIFVERAK